MAVPACAILVDQLMRRVELPLPLRVILSLAPLVPGVVFLIKQNRALAQADELALRIVNEAFAFVFYALLGLFVCVDLLENAGVLVGFQWSTLTLSIAMFVLMGLGTLIAERRYR